MFLVSRFPYPLEKGDKLRAFYQLRELSKHFTITLVAISEEEVSEEAIAVVKAFCHEIHVERITRTSKSVNIIRALLTNKPLQVGYFYRSSIHRDIKSIIKTRSFKHIYCQLIRVAEYVKNEHSIPKTIDYMDALSAGVQKRIELQSVLTKWIFKLEYRRLQRYEQHVFDFFEHRTIISEQDKKRIAHPEAYLIEVVPNGIDVSFFENLERIDRYDLVFVGNMNYPPNVNAVQFIASEILPSMPEKSLLVAGANPEKSIVRLAQNNEQITVSGWLDDIRTAYLSGKIFLAPMQIGTGLQNKLLEAMAMGTPCITTSLANNALGTENHKEILVAESKEEFITLIQQLSEDHKLRSSLAENARSFVRNNFDWDVCTKKLVDLINDDRT